MMLSVRRLTALTQLSLAGYPNLVGDAPAAALATSLPPNLAMLQMAGLRELEVGLIDCAELCLRGDGGTSSVSMALCVAPVVSLR